MNMRFKSAPVLTTAFLIVGSFTSGWATGGTAFATSINQGLVTALDSVGKNLFGTPVFGPVFPADPVHRRAPCAST